MLENDKIQFNFSYYALTLLGKQMYTNRWSAISELIANGLDAGASNVKLYIDSSDKKHSTLEIIDNGSGMSYEDLSTKYALIGRNKRISSEELSEKTKGRKGIGKLATLFLSKKYYIVSKKNGITNAWMLDSTNALDSDIPELIRVSEYDFDIANRSIWDKQKSGTLIKLVDVNMSGFAETRLEALKLRLSDYYLLENLDAKIEVAYTTNKNEKIKFEKVNKHTAFQNFYAFFSNDSQSICSTRLAKDVLIKISRHEKFQNIRHKVIEISNSDFENLTGEIELATLSGKTKKIPYELKGWIGIHASINSSEARENDSSFIRNDVYNPNRLKLYVRDKLAVENFLDYIGNTQAFRVYIEGEISFDILDNDELEDIATASREGFSKEEPRIQLLISILKPIINRLIVLRTDIASDIRKMDREEDERLLEIEREEKRRERRERRQEIQRRHEAERQVEALRKETEELSEKNESLENQLHLTEIVFSDREPEKQELFAHELNMVSNDLSYTIDKMTEDFQKRKEYEKVVNYIIDYKRSSDKLKTIKNQFLKLNTYDLIGKRRIDLKGYISSYVKISPYRKNMELNLGNGQYEIEVEVFELGVLFDNLVTNAFDNEAKLLKINFNDENRCLTFISDTAPIEIEPVEDIFKLGISTKKPHGTGVGLYLVQEICDEYNWEIKVNQTDDNVIFKIKMGE
ncbi:TPA: ATP-binding protein [Streptococcus suis]|uniref:ATP-binding protein n=1 Tax=Streptococcus suis TaxID=1307 RepID=UPI002A7BBC76|nr:ATP-binding protein [Streptococcus suis]